MEERAPGGKLATQRKQGKHTTHRDLGLSGSTTQQHQSPVSDAHALGSRAPRQSAQ